VVILDRPNLPENAVQYQGYKDIFAGMKPIKRAARLAFSCSGASPDLFQKVLFAAVDGSCPNWRTPRKADHPILLTYRGPNISRARLRVW
jgi:hypothetical protein